jgi:hypothetical protein
MAGGTAGFWHQNRRLQSTRLDGAETEEVVGLKENYKVNRTYAFAHLKCCLLIALPTAWSYARC